MDIVEKYELISQIGYVCAIVFFLIAIILFFALKIHNVFGYITGISRKKAIREINEQAGQDGNSSNITTDIKRKSTRTEKINGAPITTKIPTLQINEGDNSNRKVLKENETTLLYLDETTLLFETDKSQSNFDETTILSNEMADEFIITKDIFFIHSDVII